VKFQNQRNNKNENASFSMLIYFIIAASAFAIENKGGVQYVPLLQYESLALDSQSIDSHGLGLIMMDKDFMLFGTYMQLVEANRECICRYVFHFWVPPTI
jgi:hypothetical protein